MTRLWDFVQKANIYLLEIQTLEDLNNYVQYFNDHSLPPNFTKFKHTCFTTSSTFNITLPSVMVNNFVLGEVKFTKVVGLFIDETLVWSEHIDYINY